MSSEDSVEFGERLELMLLLWITSFWQVLTNVYQLKYCILQLNLLETVVFIA